MTERAKKRLFIAVDISDEAREATAVYIDRLKREWPDCRVIWIKPGNLHLTLKFLGDVQETQFADLVGAIQNAAASVPPFQLQITGTGVFQSERKPKVLWIGVEDQSGNLKKAVEEIEKKCSEIGFPRDERGFSPHLTIGRVRYPRSARGLAHAHTISEFKPTGFGVTRIVLYESRLGPGGSVYTPLIYAGLAG